MTLKGIVSIIFLFVGINVYSQNYTRTDIDSLEKVLPLTKGEERINTLLKLTSGYLRFQLDTARNYMNQARQFSIEENYDWGLCKSYFWEVRLDFNTRKKSLEELKIIIKKCANWFDKNGFIRDELECEVTLSEILFHNEGRKAALEILEPTLAKAQKEGDPYLLGAVWNRIDVCKNLILNRNHSNSTDSVLYYKNMVKDSMGLTAAYYQRLFFQNSGSIPNDDLDELLTLAERWEDPLLKIKYFGYKLIVADLDSADYYANEIKEISEKIGNKLIAYKEGSRLLAFAYKRAGDFETSIKLYIDLAKLNGSDGFNFFYLKDLHNLGESYAAIGAFEKGIPYFLEGVELAGRLEDEYMMNSTKRGLAYLYIVTNEDEKAEKLLCEVIDWAKNSDDNVYTSRSLGVASLDLARLYQRQGKYDEALENFNLTIDVFQSDPRMLAIPKTELLAMYLQKDELGKADSLYQEMQTNLGEPTLLTWNSYLLRKGDLLVRLGKFKEGVVALEKFLESTQTIEISDERRQAYLMLQIGYKELKSYENAVFAIESYNTIKDSLEVGSELENVAKIQSEYEISLKEAEIKDLQQQKELGDLRLSQQSSQLELRQSYIVLLSIAVLLILTIGYFLFRRYKFKREKKEIEMKAKSAEQEIKHLQTKQKAELAEVKNTLFANVSHEFRTPLTLIQVPIKTHMDNVPEQEKPLFKGVLENTNHLLRMVDELLDLSKMESGDVRLQRSVFDFGTFTTQVKSNFAPLFTDRKIQFIWINKMPSCKFNGDENRLKIVLNNLLKNALHHVHDNGEVSCLIQPINETPANGVHIIIRNTGANISEEDLPHIFTRHYRGGNESYHGNGIGLSLSKQIVELHDGEVTVDNKQQQAVAFHVKLPGRLILNEQYNPIESKSSRGMDEFEMADNFIGQVKRDSFEEANKKSILIVEDNVEMRNLLNGLLKDQFNLFFAEDGQIGEKLAHKNQPDLILSDVMMPKKDGFELLKAVKENLGTSHIPVVLLTARADAESRISGLNQNADDYIGKPFDVKELLARINNLLRQRESLHKLFSENPFLFAKDLECTPLDIQFLENAQSILEKNFDSGDFSVMELCSELALNRNSVHNKIKALTNQTTSEYIKNFRLEKAAHLIITTNMSMIEVTEGSGFNSAQAFNKAFKSRHGITPTEFRANRRIDQSKQLD